MQFGGSKESIILTGLIVICLRYVSYRYSIGPSSGLPEIHEIVTVAKTKPVWFAW